MARLAGSFNSKDDDHFGYSRSQTRQQTSSAPSYQSVSLIDALNLVEQGRMSALDLYAQMPSDLTAVIDRAAQSGFSRDFRALSSDQQRQVMVALATAVRASTESTPPPKPASTPASRAASISPALSRPVSSSMSGAKSKPWWKFW